MKSLFTKPLDLTFLEPPFNQNKEYAYHDDNMGETAYWDMMTEVCQAVFNLTAQGGAIYFMQREKNTEYVLSCLRKTGWCLQNLIIWKKKTSAVPVASKYSKHYQILAYATKGEKAKTFHRLRIEPPCRPIINSNGTMACFSQTFGTISDSYCITAQNYFKFNSGR